MQLEVEQAERALPEREDAQVEIPRSHQLVDELPRDRLPRPVVTREAAEDVVATVAEPTYQPTIVMTSDGIPTDEWEPVLERFVRSRRGAQAHRYAIAIGEDADAATLARFTGDRGRVLHAGDAADIVEYFRRITMSVTQALSRGTYESGLGDLTDDF